MGKCLMGGMFLCFRLLLFFRKFILGRIISCAHTHIEQSSEHTHRTDKTNNPTHKFTFELSQNLRMGNGLIYLDGALSTPMLRRQWIFASLFSVPVIRGLTDTEPTSRDVSVCVRGVESFSNHILIRLKTHTPTAETAVTHMQWNGKHDEDDKDEEGRRGICDNIVIVACRANFFEKASTSK